MEQDLPRPYSVVHIDLKDPIRKLESMLEENRFNLLMVDNGYLDIEIDRDRVTLNSKDLCLLIGIPPKKVQISNHTAALWVLSLDPAHVYGKGLFRNNPALLCFLENLGFSKISLKAMDATLLLQRLRFLEALHHNSRHCNQWHREIRSFLQELWEIHVKYLPETVSEWQHHQVLAFRFLQLLETHFRRHHTVHFYADALYVSPDYLTKVVRDITGKTAKQCIEERLVVASLKMLRKKSPITRIWNVLGFKTSSHFSFFFKKHTSLTPSDFRQQELGEK
ncbi:helix-turn-helix domain-containing protein [Sinomicrobium sp. M5D2P9]